MKRFFVVLFGAMIFSIAASAATDPIQVLLLDGESGGPYHNWKLTTPILQKELEDTGLFNVTVLTAPSSSGDFSSFHPDFGKYQVVVSNLDSQTWPENLRTLLEEYVN